MTFNNKLCKAHETLETLGIERYNPILHRLLRKMGVRIPPPHYCGGWLNFLLNAMAFTAIFGLINWFNPRSTSTSLSIVILLTGIMFGLFTAAYIQKDKNDLGLNQWKDLV